MELFKILCLSLRGMIQETNLAIVKPIYEEIFRGSFDRSVFRLKTYLTATK